MKKIINGKLYNTETAKHIGCYTNGYYDNDFDFMSETLYLKRTGEFFILGDGGARSIYSKSTGSGGRIGTIEIIPINNDRAMNWAEKHLSADEYISLFGEVEE